MRLTGAGALQAARKTNWTSGTASTARRDRSVAPLSVCDRRGLQLRLPRKNRCLSRAVSAQPLRYGF